MQSGLVLQKQHASACTYHTVKSHPVPRGHVTFKNATVNDSRVHNGSLKGSPKYSIYFALLPAIFQCNGGALSFFPSCMLNYSHLGLSFSLNVPLMMCVSLAGNFERLCFALHLTWYSKICKGSSNAELYLLRCEPRDLQISSTHNTILTRHGPV